MADERIYLLLKVKVPYNRYAEFNEYWNREAYPMWIRQGAKHIGSFNQYVGGPVNEVMRLFEFENVAHWDRFQKFLANADEGKRLVKKNAEYIVHMERMLLTRII